MGSAMQSKIVALLTLCFYLMACPGYAFAEYVCGQDLDGDGYADSDGETALCTQADSDWFCPVGAVDCTTSLSDPFCPSGGELNPERDLCQAPTEFSCPSDFVRADEGCEMSPSCSSGTYSPETDMCEEERYVCSIGGQPFDTLSECQSSCEGTATCEQSMFNTSGGPLGASGGGDYKFIGNGDYLTVRTGSIYLGPGVGASGGGYESRNSAYPVKILKIYGSGSKLCARVSAAKRAGSDIYTWCVNIPGATITGSTAERNDWDDIRATSPNKLTLHRYYCTGTTGGRRPKCEGYAHEYSSILLEGLSCPLAGGVCDDSGICSVKGSCDYKLTQTAPDCGAGTLDGTYDVCRAEISPICPIDYTYTDSPISICEAEFSCLDGDFDPEIDQCRGSEICPIGNQYACLGEPGASQCSPNTCFDLSEPGNDILELPEEDPMYQDDGEVDDNGNCLGQLYIFSGKATRCRPPGVTVGYINDCCDSDESAFGDSTTGNRISTMVTAVKRTYEVAKVAYYSYQISTGAMTAAAGAGGTATVTTAATGATIALEGATASGVVAAQGAVAGGATASGAVGSGVGAYAGALLNPATIAIAIVVMVAMKVLMGSGCDEKDIETALLNESNYCVYLGTVCEKKWAMVGCVQKAKRFCCFNSKMARIIHEQGRPQLKAFGTDGGWGDKKNPNCRGFTPEEFQQLDFAKIDLSEYFGDITKDMTQKVQDTQNRVQQGIQQHYEQIR